MPSMKKSIASGFMFLILMGCQTLPLISADTLEHGVRDRALIGKSRTQIEETLGPALIVRRESTHEMHCYRVESCSVLVFFDESGMARHVEKRGACKTLKK